LKILLNVKGVETPHLKMVLHPQSPTGIVADSSCRSRRCGGEVVVMEEEVVEEVERKT
jgi:hypothetical protein